MSCTTGTYPSQLGLDRHLTANGLKFLLGQMDGQARPRSELVLVIHETAEAQQRRISACRYTIERDGRTDPESLPAFASVENSSS